MSSKNTSHKLDLFIRFQAGQIDRRVFLKQLALLSGAVVLPFTGCQSPGDQRNPDIFTRKRWEILKAVQEHLFPNTEDAPGAADLNAAIYLQNNILSDKNADPEEQEFILTGPGRLETVSFSELGKSFLKLDSGSKEHMLRYINEYVWGERWLSLLLLYIFEALLADPLYGSNPDGAGWTWLEHQPGYPRPYKNQIYRINKNGL